MASCSVPLFFSVVWNEHQDLTLSTLVRMKVSLPVRVNKVFDLHLWANVIISIWIIPSHTHECMRRAHDCELMSTLLKQKAHGKGELPTSEHSTDRNGNSPQLLASEWSAARTWLENVRFFLTSSCLLYWLQSGFNEDNTTFTPSSWSFAFFSTSFWTEIQFNSL